MHPDRALSKVQSRILKGAGGSLGAARAWYILYVDEME